MKKYKYFLVCPVDIEDLLEQEFSLKWQLCFPGTPIPKIVKEEGGIQVDLAAKQFKNIIRFLKLPSKVFRRLCVNQKCFSEENLKQIIKKIAWKNYKLSKKTNIKVSSQSSRLYHKGKIKDVILNQLFPLMDHEESELEEILFRFEHNRLTISLNQWGKIYHRKNHPLIGKAPIREHFAATCFFLLFKEIQSTLQPLSQTDSHKEVRFIDPFCGSGTMLAESYFFFFNPFIQQFYSKLFNPKETKFIGFDKDQEKINKNNQFFADCEQFQFSQRDFEHAATAHNKSENYFDIIITNPPFSLRLKDNIAKNPLNIFHGILEQYHPDYLCFIFPSNQSFPEKTNQYEQVKKTKINFSGIRCYIYIYKYGNCQTRKLD